ncbi:MULTISPECIES: polysaccharide biosynthesis/export family protein [Myroides]|uniref:Polysaccharide export protein n=1 Tax=Myroides albus TaxID=2562892 RepID=A0A6I3LQE5_9FLAO|nr:MULTISPECIES: polysaccharide biosynthesis/export family protein [Myroides]MTG98362.1 polysaccharide export protein [Myroides albus]MVX35713.1 polysaccharide export protein [Myroides sp. LoEW2-1]UVD80355.1 polysaccharide biosynthesis/export family protein [Myroides albus]
MKSRISLNITVVIAVFTLLLTSCASREKIVYYQDADSVLMNNLQDTKFQTRLQPDDLLMIIVSAEDVEAAAPFNLINSMTSNPLNPAGTGQMQQQLYLIDNNGYVQFPVLGNIKLGGMTRKDALNYLSKEIGQYINNPIINLRIMNFKVTVQGEVNKPGVHSINSERLTLSEAIALSGDMTVYGKRENVLIIREIDGHRVPIRVDMTKSDFMNSPFYYLNQNDIVYVEPNKTRVNSSVVGPNLSLGLSALSLLVTIIALSTK